MAKQLVRDSFALDDLGVWDGVHDPCETWNGFACPLFTLDTVRGIAAVVNGSAGSDESVRVGDDGRVFTVFTGNGDDEVGEVLPVMVDGVAYFALGSHGWVWSVVEDDFCARCLRSDADCGCYAD